jgi:hypothetical protein
MTPQEIERTFEFIVEQQAHTAVLMYQTRVDLQRFTERQDKMQSMIELMTELAQVQSQRLDRHDETFKDMHSLQRESLSLQRQALSLLDQILVRLTRDR